MSDFSPYPLKFQPLFQHRVWGGDYLARVLPGCPAVQGYGEAWTLSGLAAAPSVCLNGQLAGQTLPEIVSQYPDHYLGQAAPAEFPVLVKLIDAAADLSVQVHPDDQVAAGLAGARGKTESWYVLQADADASIVVGLDLKGPSEVAAALRAGCLTEHLVRHHVQAGAFVHVPAGTVHALCRGVRVIEVQQTSDITYRLFDWNRVGVDGRSRQLHVVEALQSIHFGPEAASTSHPPVPFAQDGDESVRHLVQCPHYAIDELRLHDGRQFTLGGRPAVLIVANGQGQLSIGGQAYDLNLGDTYLLPAGPPSDRGVILPEGNLTLLWVAFTEGKR